MDLEKKVQNKNWRDHKRNEDVVREVEEERKLMDALNRRQRTWIGHVLRGASLLKVKG